MSTSNQIANVVIEPVDAVYGAQHLVCFTTIADTAGSLGGDHFRFSTPGGKFYVWYSHNSGVDPAPAGYTEVEVSTVVNNDTATAVATKTATAINAVAATNLFHAKSTGANLLLEAKLIGAPVEAASVNTSGFTLLVVKAGFELALGYFEPGEVSVGMSEELFDVKAHQTGSQMLGQLRTGVTAGPVTLNLIEATTAKLKTLLEKGIGVAYTPAAGTAVTAVGALAGSKQFTNVTADGGKLVLHPTKNASTNYADDLCFWLAYPKLNSLIYDGESQKKIEVEFNVFLNEYKVNEGSIFVLGDHTQNFLK
jgi:hypothetical protein